MYYALRGYWLCGAFLVVAVVALSTAVFGGTPCAHFTHNRHDTLLIGEIIAIGDEVLVIRPAGFIVSAGTRHQDGAGNYIRSDREVARYLRREAARLLRPELAVVYINYPNQWWPTWAARLRVGEYVIASLNLNQESDGFSVAWGIYRIDSLDYRTLRVDAVCFAGSYDYYTEFVNSRGYGGYFIPAGEEPPGAWLRSFTNTVMVMGAAVAVIFIGGFLAGRVHTRRPGKDDSNPPTQSPSSSSQAPRLPSP